MQKISTIIVDDHALFRIGVRATLETRYPNIAIVGEAASGAELFALLKTVAAEVVLLDILLPDMSGIEIARRLKTDHPEIKVLVITSEASLFNVEEAVNIGINGFISKFDTTPDTLAEAIHSVAQGLEYYGTDISQIISQIYLSKKKMPQITAEFSEQERRIIECCHKGLSGKQIADKLFISYKTMEWHKTNIFRKLDIHSTVELIHYVVKNGIVRN
jgi:DNA-binding NarL/FixJ family response regulator